MNALDLYASDRPDEQARYAGLEALIRRLGPDVLAVQEIIADGDTVADKTAAAAAGLRRLAAAVGLDCEVGGTPAVAVGGIIHHAGLLWRAGLTPVPGSLHCLDRRAQMWHCAVSVVFEVDDVRVRVGSVQLSPFSGGSREADAGQLLRVFHNTDLPAGFLGGDFNCVGADPGYDPDPYPHVPWHPHHVHQLGLDGQVHRGAAIRLERLGRMQDCARLGGAPWTPTTGHHSVRTGTRPGASTAGTPPTRCRLPRSPDTR